MNRILVVAALIGVTSAMPLGAQGRSQAAQRSIEIPGRNPGQGRAAPAGSRVDDRGRENDRGRGNDRARENDRARNNDRDRDDRDRDDRGRNGRYERRDRDGTRVFIDRNGLECVEKSSVKNGRRSYDLKCREPKRNNGRGVLPPPRGQDRSRVCVDANRDGRCDGVGVGRRYPDSLSDRVGAILGQDRQSRSWLAILTDRTGGR